MAAIKGLTIRAIRGVRHELPLDIDGRSLLVQGDNGTGKSSIVTALEWALRGERGPTGGTAYLGEEGFRAHVLEEPDAPTVEVVLTTGKRIAVGTKSTNIDPEAVEYRESCVRADPFLRRSQLLDFLGQRPIDRFRYLESFLDLGEADRIRARLEERATALTSKASGLRQSRQARLDAINATLPVPRRPLAVTWDSLERVFASWAVDLGIVPAGPVTRPQLVAAAAAAQVAAADTSAATQRARIVALRTEATAEIPSLSALSDLEESSRSLKAEIAKTTDASLVNLLESARTHLRGAAVETCPVCEQSVDAKELAAALDARLGSLNTVKTMSTKRTTSARSWKDAFTRFKRLADQADAQWKVKPSVAAPDGISLLDESLDTDEFGNRIVAAGCAKVRSWMAGALESLGSGLDAVLAKQPPDKSNADLVLFAQAVDEAERHLNASDLSAFPEQEIEEQAKRLAAVAAAIKRARQDIAQKLLNEIAGTVTEYYGQIHPPDAESEVTGAPSLDVQRYQGGIAHLRGRFHDKPVDDPRWVYSDGHLDTVAICVFLALRRFRANQKGDAKLMVLDDVVLSIDLGHARRLLNVLKDKFSDHQILIFTHSGLFASWVASLLPSFKRKMITGWTLEGGVRLGDLVSAAERLAKDIESSTSPKEVAQSMMTLMDEVLLDARFAYQLAVPAKRGDQYTLSELWEPFVKRVKDLEKSLKTPLGQVGKLLGELTGLPQVRNQLAAHENDFAKDFPLSTIRELSRACLALVNSIYCGDCGSFAEPIPDRNNPIAASCRCRRLMYQSPLKLVAGSVTGAVGTTASQ